MSEDREELLRELCEQASKEQDREKLMRLADEIIRLPEPKRKQRPPSVDLVAESES